MEVKVKVKVLPITGHWGPEGELRYSSTQFKTSALKMGVGGQHHVPGALPPGKTRYPLYRRLGRPQGRSERVRKISPPPGFYPRTVQPVASPYPGPWTAWSVNIMSYVTTIRNNSEIWQVFDKEEIWIQEDKYLVINCKQRPQFARVISSNTLQMTHLLTKHESWWRHLTSRIHSSLWQNFSEKIRQPR